MKAGFAEADITPNVPCPIGGYGDNVADEVLSRLSRARFTSRDPTPRGRSPSCDLIGLDRAEICLPVIEALRERGFAGGVLLTATHTHSGPHTRFPTMLPVSRKDDKYVARVKKALVDTILLARDTAATAEVGVGRAFAGENVNRRVNLEDGTHFYLPEHKEMYQYATGPTDEEIGVVAFRETGHGFPIVTLVNYTAHALIIGNWKWVVTADYPGVLAGEPREAHGRGDDVYAGRVRQRAPLRLRDGPGEDAQMGETLAREGVRGFQRLEFTATPKSRARERT